MDASDALLDAHRVPRQVEVDHDAAELKVAPLAGGLGGEQHRRAAFEARDGAILFLRRQAAVVEAEIDAQSAQPVGEQLERLAEVGEDDHALLRVGQQRRQHPLQSLGLGPAVDLQSAIGHRLQLLPAVGEALLLGGGASWRRTPNAV